MSGVFQNIDPHPLTAWRVCTPPPPPLVRGEETLARWKGGGGSIFWKTPDTALYSTYVSTLGSTQKIVFLGRLLNYQYMPLCACQREVRGIVEMGVTCICES
jgi:hypothetical protein